MFKVICISEENQIPQNPMVKIGNEYNVVRVYKGIEINSTPAEDDFYELAEFPPVPYILVMGYFVFHHMLFARVSDTDETEMTRNYNFKPQTQTV